MDELGIALLDQIRAQDVGNIPEKARALTEEYTELIAQGTLSAVDLFRFRMIEVEMGALFHELTMLQKMKCVDVFHTFSLLVENYGTLKRTLH